MTVYRWGFESPIEKMEVLPFGKEREAILYAGADADPDRLSQIREMFHTQGLTATPDARDGQPVLVVRGFGKAKEELPAAALEQNGFVNKADRQTQKSEIKKEKTSPLAAIRKSSFKMSGYVYMIGDAALAVSGIKRGDTNETMSGLAYGATSVVAALYGERKPEKVFDDLHSKMLAEFAKDGVELPKGEKLTSKELGKSGGLISKVEDFLYNYPTQILTAGNAIAGFNLFRAGMNQGNSNKKIAGALVTTGMLIGLLVPEKAKEDKPQTLDDVSANLGANAAADDVWKKPTVEEKKSALGTLLSPVKAVTDWVQEKPLRTGGYMAMGNNLFMLRSGLQERHSNPLQREYLEGVKNGDKEAADAALAGLKGKMGKGDIEKLSRLDASVPEDVRTIDGSLEKLNKADGMWTMNIVAAASYLVANGLLSISSTKGQTEETGKDGKEVKDPNAELYAAAAAIIANQPQEVQDTAINKMATFLSSQREIDMKPEKLAEKIREKVDTVKDSPWLHPEIRAQRGGVAEPAHPAVPEELPLSVQEKEPKRWADAMPQPQSPASWADKQAARDAATQENGLSGATR